MKKNRKYLVLSLLMALSVSLQACKPVDPVINPDPVPPAAIGDYQWILPPTYTETDQLYYAPSGLFAASSPAHSDKWGFIDATGKVVIPFEYDYASPYPNTPYVTVMQDGLWLVLDREDTVISNPTATPPPVYVSGLMPFFEDGQWGFLHEDGTLAIPPRYDMAESFTGGTASVKKGDAWGIIDETGNYIIEPNWHSVFRVNERFFVIGEEKGGNILYGIADDQGNIRFAPRYAQIGHAGRDYFSFVTVEDYKAYLESQVPFPQGLVTASGVVIEKPSLYGVTPLENAHCSFSQNEKYGILNNFGEVLYEPIFTGVHRLTDHAGNLFFRLPKDDDRKNDLYVDRFFNPITPLLAANLLPLTATLDGDFYHGYGTFTDENQKRGMVSLDGKIVYPAVYRNIEYLLAPELFVLLDETCKGLGDKDGNILLPTTEGYHDLVFPWTDGKIPATTALPDLTFIGTCEDADADGEIKPLYGFVRRSGGRYETAVSPHFEAIGRVYKTEDGKYVSLAKENGLWGMIELILKN